MCVCIYYHQLQHILYVGVAMEQFMNLLHNLLTYFQQGGYVFVAVCLSFSPSTVFQETWWRGVVWTNA